MIMYAIIRKDLFHQRWVWLGAAALLLLLTLFLPENAASALAIAQYPAILIISVVLAVITTEGWEEKSRGYDFLGSLPVAHSGIIAAKFLSLLLQSTLFGLFTGLLSALKYAAPQMHTLLPMVLALSAAAMLVVGAVCYSGITLFGLALFARLSLVFFLIAQVVAVALSFQQYKQAADGSPLAGIIQQLLTVRPFWVLAGALAIWVLLLGLTTRFRKRI